MERSISIFGLGYVGTVLLGCLAADGHRVFGVDIDPVKIKLLQGGQPPILEEGIQELISRAAGRRRTEFTNDSGHAVHNSEISFVCVGTPSMPNGNQDLSALQRITEQLAKALRELDRYHVFIVRSTVKPGTIEKVIQPILEEYSGKKMGKDFGLCFQPEFLREGSSIKDYYNPPFTIVGGDSKKSIAVVRELFNALPGEFIETSIKTAEMLKYCCNVFHSLKITFANEIGRLCQALEVDTHEVMDLVCRDTHLNISPAYLKPGFAFGGSCLPKDLMGILYSAKMKDVELPMLSHILPSNQIHIEHAVDTVLLTGRRSIGMVGLSFKGGTDDLRESPNVIMAEKFIGKGMDLKVYDPHVSLSRLLGANRQYIENTIPHIASLMCESPIELIETSRALVIGQNDKQFIETLYKNGREDHFVLDLVGAVDRKKIRGEYRGVCW
jgi:GDP-mannose 6-dehydrogenase